MLSRRTIELRPGAPGLPQTLITRENLIDCGQVNQVLEQAKAQAEELLSHAHAASEALLKKAHGEFWQQANAQLSHWQLEQRALCQGIESNASTVVNQALLHLFDEVPHPGQGCERQHSRRCDYPALGFAGYLLPDLRTDVTAWGLVVGSDAGDDHACGQ